MEIDWLQARPRLDAHRIAILAIIDFLKACQQEEGISREQLSSIDDIKTALAGIFGINPLNHPAGLHKSKPLLAVYSSIQTVEQDNPKPKPQPAKRALDTEKESTHNINNNRPQPPTKPPLTTPTTTPEQSDPPVKKSRISTTHPPSTKPTNSSPSEPPTPESPPTQRKTPIARMVPPPAPSSDRPVWESANFSNKDVEAMTQAMDDVLFTSQQKRAAGSAAAKKNNTQDEADGGGASPAEMTQAPKGRRVMMQKSGVSPFIPKHVARKR